MSRRSDTFVSACLAGAALLDDIDDWVVDWHQARGVTDRGSVSLDEYLGFTDAEGALWAEKPQSLRFIIAAHRYDRPVAELLESRDSFALAARAEAVEDAAAVIEWLRKTNRL